MRDTERTVKADFEQETFLFELVWALGQLRCCLFDEVRKV